MNKTNLLRILLVAVVYLLASGISYKVLSSVSVPGVSSPIAAPKVEDNGKLSFDQNLPKTQPCPLNGAKYSKQQEQWWQKHRPLGVMIENHAESRPQSGLSSADVVYEAVAEGGITRFLAVFYCQDAGQIAPVRSARTYFIDFLSEYGNSPLYAHVGGANQSGPANAIGQLADYGWRLYNDLDQFSNIPFPIFRRDEDRLDRPVATEHTMSSTTLQLWDYAAKNRKLGYEDEDGVSWDEEFVEYSFKDEESKGVKKTIHVEFWRADNNYFVDWAYDPATNAYARNNGGKPQLDKNNNKQLVAKNLVILFMQESRANDGYENNVHLLYKTKGTGKAAIFMDGEDIAGTWKKDSRTGRTIVRDSSGKEIEFNRGLIWFHIVPAQTGIAKVQ
ncbi:MAG: DUF3048 domain-containing protein [Patescibacteria group bacterium]